VRQLRDVETADLDIVPGHERLRNQSSVDSMSLHPRLCDRMPTTLGPRLENLSGARKSCRLGLVIPLKTVRFATV
jgi:hypothetical protein